MASISISEQRAKELVVLCDLGAERLKLVSSELAKTKEVFLEVEELSAFVARLLDPETAALLVAHALSLRRLIDKHQVSPEFILQEIENDLERRDWSTDQLSKWRQIRPALQDILSGEKLEIATKASDLYYKHVYHFHDLRIITNVKYVFNEKRDEVVGGIVENTVFLTYSNGGETETSIEISISQDELRRLRELADRAVSKTEVLVSLLEKQNLKARVFDTDW